MAGVSGPNLTFQCLSIAINLHQYHSISAFLKIPLCLLTQKNWKTASKNVNSLLKIMNFDEHLLSLPNELDSLELRGRMVPTGQYSSVYSSLFLEVDNYAQRTSFGHFAHLYVYERYYSTSNESWVHQYGLQDMSYLRGCPSLKWG